mgnify:CR=1 FL=1
MYVDFEWSTSEGWGGEDDDLSRRVVASGFVISRYPLEIGRYTMASHVKDEPNPKRYDLLKNTESRMSSDGISSLKYKVREISKLKLFTRIEVFYDQDELMRKFQWKRPSIHKVVIICFI